MLIKTQNNKDESKRDKTVAYSENTLGPMAINSSGHKKDLAVTKKNMADSIAAMKRRTANHMGDEW